MVIEIYTSESYGECRRSQKITNFGKVLEDLSTNWIKYQFCNSSSLNMDLLWNFCQQDLINLDLRVTFRFIFIFRKVVSFVCIEMCCIVLGDVFNLYLKSRYTTECWHLISWEFLITNFNACCNLKNELREASVKCIYLYYKLWIKFCIDSFGIKFPQNKRSYQFDVIKKSSPG